MTWHGQPNGRVRGFSFEEVELVSASGESEISDGAASTMDGKRQIVERHEPTNSH